MNNSEPEVEDSHMFFSDQGIMGFRSQANISGVQGEMNVEKQTDFLFQEMFLIENLFKVPVSSR
jgi:hypothetical protein